MASIRGTISAIAVLATFGLGAGVASAQGGFIFGYNLGNPNYNVYTMNQLPYFSQHPPVYYSYPVARTYGYSPYAYPGLYMTPTASPVHVNPVVIDNPYVEQLPAPAPSKAGASGRKDAKGEKLTASEKPAIVRGPQVIINPYVTPQVSSR